MSHEISPYLLQHSNNPVDWYPWGEEALENAKKQNKPILLSIGYAACHWCHVMERESFEDEQTASLMNEYFINIKVDREERPDLDHIYMDAVQAMTGSGGWPLNVFLTPEAKPFFGGTYFPPGPYHNRPSWKQVLESIHENFTKNRDVTENQAENLVSHMRKTGVFGNGYAGENEKAFFQKPTLDDIFHKIMVSADTEWGGFGNAPKFPQPFIIQFLLRHYHFRRDETALKQACLSLDRMAEGGIYDHLAGGFSRYSTDERWFLPHFEKMLYDNALLISVYSEAFQLTGKKTYQSVIKETIRFIQNELSSAEGGFYSSLDADSEGEEGKFYVWTRKELDEALGPDAALFCSFYGVSDQGNWEGKNILHRRNSISEFAKERSLDEISFESMVMESQKKLLEIRGRRPHPDLDNKLILNWNALMNIALSKAYAALGKPEYRELAVRNMEFLLKYFKKGNQLYHGPVSPNKNQVAFLDDYACMIQALIQLQEITGDEQYLFIARELCEKVFEDYMDEETGYFFYTAKSQQDLIMRKIEVFDGATASGNSQMFLNLIYLSLIFNIPNWRESAINIFLSMGRIISQYPLSFGVWVIGIQALTEGVPEILMTGREIDELRAEFLHIFIPYRIFQSVTREMNHLPLTVGKPIHERPQIYLCKNYTCQKPMSELGELRSRLTEFG